MVGDVGDQGPAAARLTRQMRAAYDAGAQGWDGGPGPMYRDLARALVAHAGLPLTGRRVLDLGAGTGAAGAAALPAGRRADLRQAAEAAVALTAARPVDVSMLILTGRSPR